MIFVNNSKILLISFTMYSCMVTAQYSDLKERERVSGSIIKLGMTEVQSKRCNAKELGLSYLRMGLVIEGVYLHTEFTRGGNPIASMQLDGVCPDVEREKTFHQAREILLQKGLLFSAMNCKSVNQDEFH